MKGKRWLCVLLGALLALSLGLFAACGNTEEEQQTVAVASVTVSPATLSLTEGESGTLTATIAPENATEKAVTWSSSNEEVAAVENGEVTAVGHGTAENITVSGSITAGRGNGGVVGRMTVSGTIRGCTNNAAVTGVDAGGNTGGIVGAAYYTAVGEEMLIENCTNTGAVTGYVGVGGIVGLSSANVKNCTNSGAVNGNGACVGGIVGEQQNYGAVSDNVNTADVANAFESAAVFGTGGIVGWVRYSGADEYYPLKGIIEVTGNRNSGSVTGGGSAGGIVGHLYNYGLVRENVNTAEEISAQLFASGIVGSLQFEAKNVVSALEKDTDVDIVYNASATAATGIAADFTHVYVYNNMTDGTTYDRVLEPNFATEEALDEALAALAE